MKISYLKYLIVYLDNSFVDLPNKFTNKEQIVLDLVNTKDTILQTQHATTEIKGYQRITKATTAQTVLLDFTTGFTSLRSLTM